MLQFVKAPLSHISPLERPLLPVRSPLLLSSYTDTRFPVSQPLWQSFLQSTLNHSLPPYLSPPAPPAPPTPPPGPASLLTLACGRLSVGLLVMQALAVHRDATVTVELFPLGRGRLVRRPAVGSLFVFFTAVPPGARGQAPCQVPQGSVLWGVGARAPSGVQPQPPNQNTYDSSFSPSPPAPGLYREHRAGGPALRARRAP